jgi:phosphoadenosine phosphosulfate reductase
MRDEKNIPFQSTIGGGVVLNNDNDAIREVIEMCYQKRNAVVNPIIKWTEEDVWEFLNDVVKVEHCHLYDEGYKRLGCIGCPMSGGQRMEEELNKYPKYKAMYLRAFGKMLEKMIEDNNESQNWTDAQSVMDWWIGKAPVKDKRQVSIFEQE